MRPTLTYESLHNPFHNRFNDPVSWRRDEMQTFAYEVLLGRPSANFKTQTNSAAGSRKISAASASSLIRAEQTASDFRKTGSSFEPTSGADVFDSMQWGRLFASGMALLLFLLASAAILKVF